MGDQQTEKPPIRIPAAAIRIAAGRQTLSLPGDRRDLHRQSAHEGADIRIGRHCAGLRRGGQRACRHDRRTVDGDGRRHDLPDHRAWRAYGGFDQLPDQHASRKPDRPAGDVARREYRPVVVRVSDAGCVSINPLEQPKRHIRADKCGRGRYRPLSK